MAADTMPFPRERRRWRRPSRYASGATPPPREAATPAATLVADSPPPRKCAAGATYYRNSERHQSQWELPQVDAPADAPRPTAVV